MKRIFAGLSLACLALAIPFYSSEGTNGGQVQFSAEDYTNYPGYDLDLNELRLVQLEGREPVWMTEYEKVRFWCCGSVLVATPKLTLLRRSRFKPRHRVRTSSICECPAALRLVPGTKVPTPHSTDAQELGDSDETLTTQDGDSPIQFLAYPVLCSCYCCDRSRLRSAHPP
jgi:hypothetical protein